MRRVLACLLLLAYATVMVSWYSHATSHLSGHLAVAAKATVQQGTVSGVDGPACALCQMLHVFCGAQLVAPGQAFFAGPGRLVATHATLVLQPLATLTPCGRGPPSVQASL